MRDADRWGARDLGAHRRSTAKTIAQKSILDYVMADLKRFGNIVGTADKANIDAHLTYVRDIENGLAGAGSTGAGGAGGKTGTVGTGSACGIPAAATAHAVPFKSTDNIPVVAKLHMDLAIAAFAADLTRLPSCRSAIRGRALILSWAPLNYKSGGPNPGDANTGDVNGFHAIAHRNVADKVICDTWFQSQIAYVIGQMKSDRRPFGQVDARQQRRRGMNNMRTGTHETTGVPVVMAGAAAATSRPGEAWRFRREPRTTGCWSPCATRWAFHSIPSAPQSMAASSRSSRADGHSDVGEIMKTRDLGRSSRS